MKSLWSLLVLLSLVLVANAAPPEETGKTQMTVAAPGPGIQEEGVERILMRPLKMSERAMHVVDMIRSGPPGQPTVLGDRLRTLGDRSGPLSKMLLPPTSSSKDTIDNPTQDPGPEEKRVKRSPGKKGKGGKGKGGGCGCKGKK